MKYDEQFNLVQIMIVALSRWTYSNEDE